MRTKMPGHPNPPMPKALEEFSEMYKNNSWREYTLEELGQAVAFFCKRSQYRSDARRRAKDLRDANNYLGMLTSHVDAFIRDAYMRVEDRTERNESATEQLKDLL